VESAREKSRLDLRLPFHPLVDSLVDSLEGGVQDIRVLHCRVLDTLETVLLLGAVLAPRVAGVE